MRTLLYVLDDNVALGIELLFAERDESTMNEHFGSSLVAVRLIAYLREPVTHQSVATCATDASTFVAIDVSAKTKAAR
jgi:hypothetical protein